MPAVLDVKKERCGGRCEVVVEDFACRGRKEEGVRRRKEGRRGGEEASDEEPVA